MTLPRQQPSPAPSAEDTRPVAAVLLAAGRATRFGGDKLAADCGGRPVLGLAAAALREATPGRCLAVLRDPAHAALLPAGYETALCDGQQSDSLRVALDWARDAGALLVALADMPFVTPGLHRAVIARLGELPACARAGDTALPPAIFPASWFPRLSQLRGDRGAGALLSDLPASRYVTAPASEIRDIDRPGDLPAPRSPA